ncbi:MAG: peptidylprolyl isomerase [Nitrospirae bacterium]|nr:peptidylprolyl isomerase [Nitrospirota bacterium]
MSVKRQTGRFIAGTTILIAILLIVPCQSFGITGQKILATVDSELITFSEYQRFAKGAGITENTDIVDEDLLKRLVDAKIILLEAFRNNIEVTEAGIDEEIESFKELNALSQKDLEIVLAKEGMNVQSYRKLLKDKIMSVKLITANVDSKVAITDREIADYYTAHKMDFLLNPEKSEVKAIFLKLNEDASITEITELKRTAMKISAQLKNGESFENLMDKYSDKNFLGPEGRLGEFTRGSLIPPLDKKVFSMKKGEMSEPVWIKDGVYILKLINRTDESYKPLESVRDEIHKYLYEPQKEKLFNEWMRSLWEKTSVTIN